MSYDLPNEDYDSCLAPRQYIKYPEVHSLAPVPVEAKPATCCRKAPNTMGAKKEEKENTMDYNMEVDQRNHLKRRLDGAKSTTTEALKTKFRMQSVYPKTKDDILAALKAGNYFLDPEYFNADGTSRWGHAANHTIQFADKDRDEAGFKTAKDALDKAFTVAKDKIIVLPLTEGLAALTEFETATF